MTGGRAPPAENCPVNGMVVVRVSDHDRQLIPGSFLNVIIGLMRRGGFTQ
jgi:hypothetical protein